MPRLSVLMPAWNAAGTIDAAVRSTLRAMPADAELHILDDRSTDDTAERVAALQAGDRRIRLTRGAENVGIARGLQQLLEATDAEFVGRMDADDVSLPYRFRAGFAALSRGADLAFSTFQVIDGAGRPRVPMPPIGFSPRVGALALLLDCPYPHSSLLARRSALADVGGYRGAVTEDYDLWLRAAAAGARIARVARPGILLRAHASSVSAQGGFRERLAADPLITASYRALVARLLPAAEATAPWLPELAFLRSGPLSAAGRAVLAPFVAQFTAALDAASPGSLERWSLARRARQELASRAG